jgi:predicted HD phosphohydrolase
MKCPGQDSRYWKPGAIFEVKCPKCKKAVEFFKDDTSRKCNHCGHRFVNPEMDFGCAAYCQFAEQCVGTLPPEVAAQQENLLKDKVAVEMKRYFKQDFKRIGHAMRVARYAERIGKLEAGNMAVIFSAAYLHDIGIHMAEEKYGSNAPKYQEKEGPEIAKTILSKLGANEKLTDAVCDIVGHHHHPKPDDTVDFKIVYDSDLIANIEDKLKDGGMDSGRLQRTINSSFLTESGRQTAEEVLLKGE